MEIFYEFLGSKMIIFDDKKKMFMVCWCNFLFFIYGVEGVFFVFGVKMVIFVKVIGKFFICMVFNMEIEKINECVVKYVEDVFKKFGFKNIMKVYFQYCGNWWVVSFKYWNFLVVVKVIEWVWGVQFDFICEGGFILVMFIFEQVIGKNVFFLLMGSLMDGVYFINEKFDKWNYIEGIKFLGVYLYYVVEEF